jgi:hypothetical protein
MWGGAGILKVAALAAALAAASVACESNTLRALGGAGGVAGHPVGRDAGAGGAIKLGGDASVDRPFDATVAPLGASCTGSTGCASGFCVEGVCCTTACTGGCQTCSAPGAVGTCLERATGSPPRQPADCPLHAPATCGLDGTCDGAGACRFYLLGVTCLSGVCANGAVTGVGVCDGQGNCRPGPTLVCAPYDCDSETARCKASCASDDDCFGGQHCHNGACGDPPRESCGANEECASGFCTDGVCCDTACTGLCVSCALPGRVGACSPVPVGEDPRGVCVDEGAPSCGHDGTCDGQGACAFYPAGVTCAATPSCSGTLWSGTGTCDGAGTCQRETRPCLPYACDPQTNACHNACATADDCAPGKPCLNGTCGYLEPAACSSNAECASGFCAQGACCATKCDGPCFSCALPGTMGTCTPVPNPVPPDAGACAP